VRSAWPENWDQLIRGIGCEMCNPTRPDNDTYGIRIHATEHTDAVLQRMDVQPGYTLVIWRGSHITEPTELTDIEASLYWADVLTVARALINHYRPLKMNYETLGNSLPHLHTHLLPRYTEDPAPGQPFPLPPLTGAERRIPEQQLQCDADALRSLLEDGGA
jgi:diadenosine tetraphosphate (Ap4A) HIT family hydrolase